MTLSTRKVLDSIKPHEMMRVIAGGHEAIVFPATGGQAKFHLTYITADEETYVAPSPLAIRQLAITFEKYGYPVDVALDSFERVPCDGFGGCDCNPYALDEQERAAWFGAAMPQGANDATY